MTVTFHNGSAAHREHNTRKPSVVAKQEHINPELSNRNVTFVDIPPREAYDSLFDDALRAYNSKQKRPERRISDYYNHISDNPQKHTVYECIVQVGSRDDCPPFETENHILAAFFNGWAERNPNLFVCGAYLHADEDGGAHMHIDYIPFADGYKNGLSRQSALVRAFGQQGITGSSATLTAQIIWERRERQALAELCIEQGLSVDATVGGRKHEDTPEFKAKKAALGELDAAISERAADLREASFDLDATKEVRQNLAAEAEEYAARTAKLKKESERLDKALEVKRRVHSQDVAGLAAPVPALLSLTHRHFVMVKKDDWERIAAQARNEFVANSQLAAEKERRQRTEADNANLRREVEPLRSKVYALSAENDALREENRSLRKVIIAALDYLRERVAPAIFEAIDRIVDRVRAPEHQKYRSPTRRHERGGYDGPEM